MKKLFETLAIVVFASATMAAAPAQAAASVRPAMSSVSPNALGQTLSGGRVGAATGSSDKLFGAGGAAVFFAIAGAGLFGFAFYKIAKGGDNPSSR